MSTHTISIGSVVFQVTDSGRIHMAGGELVIEDVMPSDGGLYSCMAVGVSGNASRDVAIHSKSHYQCDHVQVHLYPRLKNC